MRLRFMSAKFVALQPTLGIVFQERGVIRLCFVWWHLVIDWSQPTKRTLDGAKCYRPECSKLAGDTGYCNEHAPF
jgi:hypothetical protein